VPSKLRIAVDARSLLCAQPRGEGKSLLRLYEELHRTRPDIEPVLFGDGSTPKYQGQLPEGARIEWTNALGDRWNAWENIYFPAAARMQGCKVMHCTSSGAPRFSAMPTVLTVHDLIPLTFDDGHGQHARELFLQRLQHGLRQAHKVLAVSEHTRRDLLGIFPSASALIDVAPWGAEPLQTQASHNTAAAEGMTVLVFGGEAKRKNTEFALERYIAVAHDIGGLRLELVGINSTAQRRRLADRVQEAGLRDRVHMPGFVSEQELEAIFQRSTMLLYLSLYEGFGLPLLEAIGKGLPVVASDRTSIPEILQGAPGCHALSETDAIELTMKRLASDVQFRQHYAQAQQTVLPRFNWARCATQLSTALESAAQSSWRYRDGPAMNTTITEALAKPRHNEKGPQ